MRRREALLVLGALPFACKERPSERKVVMNATDQAVGSNPSTTRPMPVLFLAHGAPILLDDAGWVAELSAWGRAIPKPRAILVVSAHWENRPIAIGATAPVPLVYDFYGFPDKYYRQKYPSPGAPLLAKHVRELLRHAEIPFVDEPNRGLDHGAYVPLVAMYESADVPVLQVSLPALDPKELVALGHALAPLRQEGVLLVGSGFLTHNMGYAFRPGVPSWAREFDDWAKDRLLAHDVDALSDFHKKAPAARTALPTWEHYAPLLVSLGATSEPDKVTFPISGFWMEGAFTRRSVQFG